MGGGIVEVVGVWTVTTHVLQACKNNVNALLTVKPVNCSLFKKVCGQVVKTQVVCIDAPCYMVEG